MKARRAKSRFRWPVWAGALPLGMMLLLALAMATPCSRAADPEALAWKEAEIPGLTIELIDPEIIEWMSFSGESLVAISLGRKHRYVTAPLFYWQVVGGRLQITEDKKKVYEELTLISRDPTTITARRRDGQIAKYKILQRSAASASQKK